MSYLDATVPADTEAVRNGASRIRAMASALNTVLSKIFNDSGEFLAGWITSGMFGASSVASNALAASAVTNDKVADATLGIVKLAQQNPGSLISFDANSAPILIAPGTNGQFLKCTGAAWVPADLPVQTKGVPVFISPAVLVSNAGQQASWATLSGLGVPATASALILSVSAGTGNGPVYVYLRAGSTAPTYTALTVGATSGGDYVITQSQGIYPFNAAASSIDWSTSTVSDIAQVTITLIGYIG